MVEGLWCLFLGSYQHKGVWMILRRRFGLPDVGEQGRGGNCKSPIQVEVCWPKSRCIAHLYLPSYDYSCSYTLLGQAAQVGSMAFRTISGRPARATWHTANAWQQCTAWPAG
ncbi:hypothetical protein BCV69DRAFT_28265 [Microstroma glucosiphilum]|uniref:Uncharacterized protein n=1 Tax=Pseudomicrostroma glucosiphilum TaxID=1684307 RepID=A0A316U4D9_9BASI|nr:hypothetical protein BCV69DRAFT_28265 [Pseudomicrostroma glucosiphilum]PWN19678.1 hypothetical protein BCV69DRAFT_28265 [Pseudomicrostroma glucosiphilum]